MTSIKLYHYLHCPYCIRVRLAFGFLKISYESIVLPYEDEKTPLQLTGVKMLPITTHINGSSMNESLDIIKYYDVENLLKVKNVDSEMEQLIDKLGKNVHALCMPYFIYSKEFNEKSRTYFQTKKEKTKGPFSNLVKNRAQFEHVLTSDLLELESRIDNFYESTTFSIKDVMISAHLWGLYILPEFQFTPKMHFYLQRIKDLCNFNYYENLWE